VFRAAVRTIADRSGRRAGGAIVNAIAARIGGGFGTGAARPTRQVSDARHRPGARRLTVALLAFGLVMVYSASVALADNPAFRELRATATSCTATPPS